VSSLVGQMGEISDGTTIESAAANIANKNHQIANHWLRLKIGYLQIPNLMVYDHFPIIKFDHLRYPPFSDLIFVPSISI